MQCIAMQCIAMQATICLHPTRATRNGMPRTAHRSATVVSPSLCHVDVRTTHTHASHASIQMLCMRISTLEYTIRAELVLYVCLLRMHYNVHDTYVYTYIHTHTRAIMLTTIKLCVNIHVCTMHMFIWARRCCMSRCVAWYSSIQCYF